MTFLPKSKSELKNNHQKNSCKKSKVSLKRLKLNVIRSRVFARAYHPLKQRMVKLQKIKFVEESPYFSKKHITNQDRFTDKATVIAWLATIGIIAKKISAKKYYINGKICEFIGVLLTANQKRTSMRLAPFLVEGISD